MHEKIFGACANELIKASKEFIQKINKSFKELPIVYFLIFLKEAHVNVKGGLKVYFSEGLCE